MANPFKIVKQDAIEWCWAAVGATINNYFSPDSPEPQCRIAFGLLHDNRCCDTDLPNELNVPEPLQDVLTNLKVLKEMKPTVLSFEEIRTQIDASLPVCARISWFQEYGAHFVVIYGWGVSASGQQWLDIADPFFPDSTIPYDYFVASYQDAGEWTDTYLVQQN